MSVGLLDLKLNWRLAQEMMDGRAAGTGTGTVRASSLVAGNNKDYNRSISQGNNSRKSFPASYFSVESFMVLICLTASLLILPVILPPLPPPPFMLLLLPIAILLVLMILAFMPSDIRDIASSFV
ncbi:ARGOS-like protein [Telopea speciosissima]|uniref:ARGOS-like protein n=1 Tax=Telopea speciosissima TaxID=54955 RepID=UPI001CC6EFA3|nr:ARGOS-like protein [Telopea speciosissima]